MESKKDIGKFFRENLDQLDVAPSAMVWDGIEEELKEKKKKRPFFIWFFIAAFIGGSLCTYTILHLDSVPNFNSTDDKNSSPQETIKNSNDITTTDYNSNKQKNPKNTIDSSIGSTSNKIESATNTNSKNTASSSAASTTVTSEKNSERIHKNSKSKNRTNKNQNIAFNSKKTKQKQNLNSKTTSYHPLNQLASVENSSEKNSEKNVLDTEKTNLQSITETKPNPTAIDSLQKKNNTLTEKEKSLNETKKDSVPELPKEKEYNIIIAPYYGYSYAGKFGGGNSLSTQYNVLDEGGKVAQNFGVVVRWMGTEKIGIQTGIGMVQTNRFTEVEKNDIFFSNNTNLELDNPLVNYSTALQNDQKVKFYEENSYIEVPIEVYYVLSNKKFGLASSFGVSLFLLNKNDVYLESENLSKFKIGTSKNSAAQSFVINTKLNLFYNLSKRIQLDVYPEFQFQIMSHKNVSSFYPYYLSLKAGISYKL
ncbi:hypothetical protein [Flavobacterium sp.]|uniref:hypothetical protein n=1 Tax=Flavobacterium sp. TaxID=239 RepID=UPI002B4AEC05|nr:hypothetical protein [Flavobacterium sp.]HLP65666.1 hypothetical protein [Flavobacterium sp.]